MVFPISPVRALAGGTRAVALGAALALAGAAHAFPDRTVTIIVPAVPGGTADISARQLAEPLSRLLGQSVVVENRAGGSGVVGAQALLNARPDGHTLLMQFSGFHVMTPQMQKVPFDPLRDLAPVANVYSAPQVMVIRGTLPFKDAGEFIAHARSNKGRLNYASAGNGSVQHIAAELFEQTIAGGFVHIPYKGTGAMLADLLANNVDFMLTTAPPLIPHIQSGRIRALFVTAPARLGALPNVPTAAEVGMKGLEVASWFAIYAHGQTPPANVQRLAADIQKVMATPEFRGKAAEQGAEAIFMGPQQLNAYQRAEWERWGKVIRSGNIKAD